MMECRFEIESTRVTEYLQIWKNPDLLKGNKASMHYFAESKKLKALR